MWEGVGDWTELQHIDPHSIGHNRVSFPFSWAAQPGAWEPTLLGAGFLYRILSPTGLVSKLTDFLSSPSYIIVHRSPSCGRHKLHSFNPSTVKVIDRMHLLFTKVRFLFWQPSRVVGQYTTNGRNICCLSLMKNLWFGCMCRLTRERVYCCNTIMTIAT